MKIGIIGGSGLYGNASLFDGTPKQFRNYRSQSLRQADGKMYTFLGKVLRGLANSVIYSRQWREKTDAYVVPLMQEGRIGETDVVFISRHGEGHGRLAHEVNYRAIMAAMSEKGVDAIMTTAAVGTISPNYKIGDFVVLADAGEPAAARQNWVYSPSHFGLAPLYDQKTRAALIAAGRELGLTVHDGGTYALRPGPEFETSKEIQDLRILGYSVVGMTTVTEAKMAKQLGIPLATICIVTNAAQKGDDHSVTDGEVQDVMKARGEDLVRLLRKAAEKLAQPPAIQT